LARSQSVLRSGLSAGKTKVDIFQFCGPHELCQLKRRYVPGNQPHEGPSKSRSVVARFVDVAGNAVRDLVQQEKLKGRSDPGPGRGRPP
jgi:hypothetical protein